MDFNRTIFENRQEMKRPMIAAHRGVSGANIPCNTLESYNIAIKQGAEIVEIDVAVSGDRKHFVFHPNKEPVFLKSEKYIREMTEEEISSLRLYNFDGVVTHYKVPTLFEVLSFLKDKVYINIDKFWTDVEGISREIRKAGVEKQVIVKTFYDEKIIAEVKKYASDFMYMIMVREDEVIDEKLLEGLNIVGEEILFDSESRKVVSDEHIKYLHNKNRLVWVNAIIYNEEEVISANHTDDIALNESEYDGWGWLIDKGVDIIQTDWLLELKHYLEAGY